VAEACSAAADGGYLKLSTLISQAGSDDLYKNDIIGQLDIWQHEKLAPGSNPGLGDPQNGLVGRGVWKVYNLLGGLLTSEGQESKNEDILCAGLDWKRTFGLCLWYGTSVDSSVADAVNTYERILLQVSQSPSSTSNQIAQPIPKWAISKNSLLPSSLASSRLGLFTSSLSINQAPDDPLFALIKLYADPTLSLSKALNPLSFSPLGLDWGIGMCWHLYIILSRILRVRDFADRCHPGAKSKHKPPGNFVNGFGGTGHREPSSSSISDISRDEDDQRPSEGHSPTADLLISSYAFELESWGMIQEAAFVLLHLEGSVGYVSSTITHEMSVFFYFGDHLIGAKRLSKIS
jgi:nuclear pore complex protein Nup98-Nup96